MSRRSGLPDLARLMRDFLQTEQGARLSHRRTARDLRGLSGEGGHAQSHTESLRYD